MFKEIPGNHCEVCLAPVQDGFYKRHCRRFHGTEYLCPTCRIDLDRVMGPKTLAYIETVDGCLFEELMFAEERLKVVFKRPERKIDELA